MPSTRAIKLSPRNADSVKLGRQLLIDVLCMRIKEAPGTKESQRRTSLRPGGCEEGSDSSSE